MDVSCPSCDTLYELDDRHFDDDRRATFKCSSCGQLFQLQHNGSSRNQEGRRWMIRRQNSGDILYCSGFDVLHQWLVEGRVTAGDTISRTGNSWKRLGDIGELAPIFEVVESIADIAGDDREESTDTSLQHATSAVQRGAAEATDDPDPESTPPATTPEASERTDNAVDQTSSLRQSEADSNGRTKPGPGVQLEGRRFGSAERTDDTENADGTAEEEPAGESTVDDQTFGQLEHHQEPPPEVAGSATGRRWPWVLAAVVALSVGAGVWQYDAIQQFADDVAAQSDRGEGETGDDRRQASEPMRSIEDEAEHGVAQSLEEARERQYRAGMTGLVSDSVDALRDAVDDGRQAASDAAQAREAAARGPSTVSGYIDAGRRARDRGAIDDARRYFEEALEMSSSNPAALVGLGWTELSDGRDAQAIELFERARRQDPSASEALIGLGRAERNRGRQQAALDAYEAYLREFPGGDQASIAEYQSEQLRRAIDQ